MSARKIIRIVMAVVVLVLLWQRIPLMTGARRMVLIVFVVALLAAILLLMRKPRNLKDQVPKRPLGLE